MVLTTVWQRLPSFHPNVKLEKTTILDLIRETLLESRSGEVTADKENEKISP